jgi:hypothetical protein
VQLRWTIKAFDGLMAQFVAFALRVDGCDTTSWLR